MPDSTVEFTLPNGRILPASSVTPDGKADDVQASARRAADGRCQWQGDRLDLDWTLMTLFSHTPWHDPWRTAWNEWQSGSAESFRPLTAVSTPRTAPVLFLQGDEAGGCGAKAAGVYVEAAQVIVEVDVQPLATRRLRVLAGNCNDAGADVIATG